MIQGRKKAVAEEIIADLSNVEAVKDFAERVWTWWCQLQPTWRTVANNRPAPFNKFGGNYLQLDKHGQNGWLGLLICTKWWRLALNKLGDHTEQALDSDWLSAVEDMTEMLKGMVGTRLSNVAAP